MKKSTWKNVIFLLPFIGLYFLFTLYPFIRGIYMSFFNWSLLKGHTFIGVENYTRVLGDSEFYKSLLNTVRFVLYSTVPLVLLGFVFALIVNRNMPLIGVLRTIFFIPNVLSVSVVAIIWSGVLGGYGSLVNSIITLFGGDTVYWFKTENLAWFSIVLITVWWTVGFNMLIFLAALQNIPSYLYEAAAIDGATSMKVITHITLPQIAGTFRVVTFLQIISSFKVFAQIFLVTKGGPAGSTMPVMQYLYDRGMGSYQFGFASAISVIIFMILLILSLLQNCITRKKGEDYA